jgi:hypothetical protein
LRAWTSNMWARRRMLATRCCSGSSALAIAATAKAQNGVPANPPVAGGQAKAVEGACLCVAKYRPGAYTEKPRRHCGLEVDGLGFAA